MKGSFYLDIDNIDDIVIKGMNESIIKFNLIYFDYLALKNEHFIINLKIVDHKTLNFEFCSINDLQTKFSFDYYYYCKYTNFYVDNFYQKQCQILDLNESVLYEIKKIDKIITSFLIEPINGDFSFKDSYQELKSKFDFFYSLEFYEHDDPDELKHAYMDFIKKQNGSVERLEDALHKYEGFIPKVHEINFFDIIENLFADSFSINFSDWKPNEYKFSIYMISERFKIEIKPSGLRSLDWWIWLNNISSPGLEYLKECSLIENKFIRRTESTVSTWEKIYSNLKNIKTEIALLNNLKFS